MTAQCDYDHWSISYDDDTNLTRDLDQQITCKILGKSTFNRILEIGCGTGKNTGFLSTIAHSVFGLDFSVGMIQKARQSISQGVLFIIGDISRRWPLQNSRLDLVACSLVLEHIENLDFVFSESWRCLVDGGFFFISELHPFRQYTGSAARYQYQGEVKTIPSFRHHVSDFINTAHHVGFELIKMNEWWHEEDIRHEKLPRLATFMFQKSMPSGIGKSQGDIER